MERELFDITPSQNANLYAQKFSFKKCVTNVATSIVLLKEFDDEILKKAINLAVNRSEAMRLRFVKEGKVTKQYFVEHDEVPVGIMDLRGKTEEEKEKIIFKDASKKHKLYDGRQFRIYIITDTDGYKGLYLNTNHMILDSSGIMIFYKDVLDIYEALVNKTDMPKPMSSYKEVLKKELAYKTSDVHTKDREFWQKYWEKGEPIFTGLNGPELLEKRRKKKKNPDYRASTIFSFIHTNVKRVEPHISPEKTEKWMRFSMENKVPFQCIVFLATRSFLSAKNNRTEDVIFTGTVARRSTLAEKKCGGSRVHFFPLRTIFKEDVSAIDALNIIKDEQTTAFRHTEMDPMEVRDIRKKLFNIGSNECYEDLSITYQPLKVDFEDVKVRTKWHCNGVASNPLYLTIMHGEDKGLDFYYEYQIHRFSKEYMEEVHVNIENLIDKIVENKDVTIGTLLDSVK